QLGRSREFLQRILPQVCDKLGAQSALNAENFVRLTQRVKPGLIRVDADELSYPAHVILRFEIERALIEGDIEVEDIPALWDEKMKQALGLDTRGNYRDGCMQDIHWTDGAFGYFPTYTLGAMYAAQLFQAVKKALPDLGERLQHGDLQPIFDWLQQNIWQHGSRFPTEQLLINATGEALNPRFFRQHLEQRYLNR
ncbi:MAG TPA: carboxypeptidase M32, partial [Pantoea sp.]|nr:carboxypeptidase M32 [Pantoea sp.]